MTEIKCPKCGEIIDINQKLAQDIGEKFKKQYEEEIASLENKLSETQNKVNEEIDKQRKMIKDEVQKQAQKEHEKAIQALNDELKAKSEQIQELNRTKAELTKVSREKDEMESRLKADYEQKLKKEITKNNSHIKQEIEKKMQEEAQVRFEAMQSELDSKNKQLQEYYQMKTDLAKLRREKEESESKIRADYEQKFLDELSQQLKKRDSDFEIKLKEKDAQLSQIKRQLDEAHKKAEQGSMQIQGEAQETAIEEYLREQFPFDRIEEIKKGQKGADCLQKIIENGVNCGSILYESKNTKNFSEDWINKFKDDIQESSAKLGVLITRTMPKNMDRMELYKGIWICSYDEFKGLSYILRAHLVEIARIEKNEENKTEKTHLLYDYLVSERFRMQVQRIVESFVQMKQDLDQEKRAMQKLWTKREKQIEILTTNTTDICGAIEGIAGSAIELSFKPMEIGYDDE